MDSSVWYGSVGSAGFEGCHERAHGVGDGVPSADKPGECSLQGVVLHRRGQVLYHLQEYVRDFNGHFTHRRRQVLKEGAGRRSRAEAAQGLERRQREDHLRLVVVVLVVPFHRGTVDAGGLLAGEARPGLFQGGVDLEGQRALGRQDLEQERQAGAELGHTGTAEMMRSDRS